MLDYGSVAAPLALLLSIVFALGLVRLVHSSNPLRRRLLKRDDKLYVKLCKTGFTGRVRRLRSPSG